jgi:uncharacterized membrane protein YfcA
MPGPNWTTGERVCYKPSTRVSGNDILCAIPVARSTMAAAAKLSLCLINMLAPLFGAISLLYATVGQAGGTSFLALMAFALFSPNQMRPTALMLNVVAASYSTWLFNRGRFVDWAKLTPLLVSSVPTALVGGLIVLDERRYKTVTGLLLLSAATVLTFRKAHEVETDPRLPYGVRPL